MDLITNQVIKGYELRERIGAGGNGVVYRAFQPATGREVAIKAILPEYANRPEFIRRFEAEAQFIARLEHPHIVPLYDYWRDSSGAYLVMRWLRSSLRRALRDGPWSVENTARLLDQMGGALSVAHRSGIIHRDIKPDNILLDEDNNAYLADFGIAKYLAAEVDLTPTGAMVGSPAYTTPEQLKGEPATFQSDLYSLGLVLYEVLTAEKPFKDATTPNDFIFKHLNELLPSVKARRPELPSAVDAVIQTATAKDPAHRYPDVLRMAGAFRAALPAPVQRTRPQPLVEPLTDRELDILNLLTKGLSNNEIAARLVLSITTVKWYLRQIFSKLDVHNRVHAVERAQQLGIFDPAKISAGGGDGETVLLESLPTPSAQVDELTSQPEPMNPYKGLRAYQEADASEFFGREALTQQLIARFAEQGDWARFLAVVGPSGSGKSSVVRAGLVPALRRGVLPDSARWFLADMLPGTHPMEELEAALLRIAVNKPESLISQLREDERGLARALKRILPNDQTPLMLFIDQFEEVFTLVVDEAERLHFLNSLHAALTDPRGRLWVIMTLRADFYDRPLLYERFAALLKTRSEVVLPLSVDELTRAIVQPAAHVGVSVESDVLAALLKDVGEQPGTLPLLQYTLTELFERRRGNQLTLENYRASGGLSGTLARRADELYESLEPAAQETVRQLFLRLVSLGEGVEDTRRRVLTSELVAPAEAEQALDEVLDTFSQYCLLSFDRDPLTRTPTVEVAHEALIRHWGRLRTWLNDSREDLYVQRRLMVAAAEWARSGREASFLASGARLAQFEALAAAGTLALNPEETAYLTASAAERERQEAAETKRVARELTLQRRAANRLRYLAGALALFLVIAVGLSAVALDSRAKAVDTAAELSTSLAHSEAVRLALESLSLMPLADDSNERIALLAIRSVRTSYTPQGDHALVRAAERNFPVARFALEPPFIWSFDGLFSPDGTMILTSHDVTAQIGSGAAELWLWDAHTYQPLRKLEGAPFQGFYPPIWSQDSKYILIGIGGDVYNGGEAVIHLWEAASGRIVQRFSPSPDLMYETYALTPDGKELYVVVVDADEKYAIRYWDVRTGEAIRRVELPFSGKAQTSIWLSRIAHPDAQELALVTSEGEAPQIWDVRRALKVRDLEGITNRSIGAVFSPSQRYVAMSIPSSPSPGVDVVFSVRVWDTNTGRIVWDFPGFRSGSGLFAFTLDFSHDDRYLLTGNTGNATDVRLWDLAVGKEVHRWDFEGASVAFSPDTKWMAIAHHWGGQVLVFPLQSTALPIRLPHPNRIRGVDYSHNGKLIATAGGDGIVRLWNTQTFAEERQLIFSAEGASVTEIRFSKDDRYLLATGGRGNSGYRLWDVQTGQQVWYFQGQEISRWALAMSSDGKWMVAHDRVSQNDQFEVQIVEVGTGKITNRLPLPAGINGSRCTPFSPDDRYVVVMNESVPNVLLWEWRSNQPPRVIVNDEAVPSSCGAFTLDGKYVFLGGVDGIGRLYDVATGAEVRRYFGHTSLFLGIDISPDGLHILTSSGDKTARIWELATGREVRRFTFDEDIWGAAYSPDGSFIVIGSYVENAAFVFRTDLNAEILDLCAKLTRDFTDAERTQYGISDHNPTCPQPDGAFPPTQTPIPTGTIPIWTPLPLTPLPIGTP